MVSLVVYLRFFCSFLFILFFFLLLFFFFFLGRSILLWTSLLLHHTDFFMAIFSKYLLYILGNKQTSQKKKCYSFYCVIHFNLMVGNQTHDSSEVCLCILMALVHLQCCKNVTKIFRNFSLFLTEPLCLWNSKVPFLFPFRLW